MTIATVHQAKGMQWPAVFLPCLRANRFPSKRQGGLSLFHVIPEAAIADADRYRGTVEDETRLFYVAVTRAQKYLYAVVLARAEPALPEAVRRSSTTAPRSSGSRHATPACRRTHRGLSPSARHETPRSRSRSPS